MSKNVQEIKEMNSRLREIESTYKFRDFPQTVLVESSAHCNINCIQCAQSDLTRKKGYMKMDLYRKIVDEVAERDPTTKFWFAFYGEPLLARYSLYYMIDYAKKKGLTDTYLNTNGVLLSEEMAEMLLDSGLDHIIVGIDGFSAEVFEKIRKGAKRDVVYNNVLTLKRKMKERGVSKPRIEAQFIVMDENEHELREYVDYWTEQEVAVKIRNRTTWTGLVEAGHNIDDSLERVACGWAIGICPISWDGKIVGCAADGDVQFPHGDVNEQSIYEIWNGPRKEFVEKHLQHRFDELPAICQSCMDWQVIGTVDFDEKGERYQKEFK